MEKRTLGRTGLSVSVLGLGGHTYPVGEDGFCSHEQRAQLVSRLIEQGVNYFDTTWVNEVELLADSFRRCGAGADCHVSLQYVDGISDARWRENLYKYPQAAARLFPVAQSKNIGVAAMKVFCWDCGPDQWGRRISVFEPVEAGGRAPSVAAPSPAQESLKWVLQHPAVSISVPAMNAMWEVEQNLQAVKQLADDVKTDCFAPYRDRLWDAAQLAQLARSAESRTIRERAAALLP